MAAARHVGFSKFNILSSNFCTRAIVPPHSKFRLNRTIWSRVIAKNDFQYGVRPPRWIWEFLKFSHISVAMVKICVRIPNFVIFGQFAAEIWRYNDFQNGGCPLRWIYCDVIILYRKTEFNALDGGAENDGHEIAGHENGGQNSRTWKCKTWNCKTKSFVRRFRCAQRQTMPTNSTSKKSGRRVEQNSMPGNDLGQQPY